MDLVGLMIGGGGGSSLLLFLVKLLMFFVFAEPTFNVTMSNPCVSLSVRDVYICNKLSRVMTPLWECAVHMSSEKEEPTKTIHSDLVIVSGKCDKLAPAPMVTVLFSSLLVSDDMIYVKKERGWREL